MKDSQKTIADALDADTVGKEAGSDIGEGISSGISAKAVVLGNIVTDAIRSAVGKVVDVGKEIAAGVYEGYAQNEQLVGGIQKLFGNSGMNPEEYAKSVGKSVTEVQDEYASLTRAQNTVLQNANNAWSTAGMSANDYMQNVTGIAASLVKSTGGDTEEAARLADQAIRDISDNVNTFGTNAENVQNAVMGLSRGNYTMLDNLSLGYAGTQQGMLDLINDSGVLGEKLTDTSQLADVGFDKMLEAIHAVQDETNITGTTAREAMGTLEGSANATKAAWENVLTAIGTGETSTVEDAASGLVDSLFGTINEKTGEREGGLIANVLGLADRAFYALGSALPGMLDMALNALPPEIGGPLREAFETIGQVVETVAPVVSAAIGGIVSAIGTIAPVVAPLLPIIASVLGAVKIAGVITTIVGAVTGFITTAGAAIGMISSLPGLIAVITTALGGPVTIIAAIVGAIVAFIATNEDARNAIVEVWNSIKEAVTNAVQGIGDFLSSAWTMIQDKVIHTVANIAKNVVMTWTSIKSSVASVVGGIVSTVSTKFQTIVGRVKTIFNSVKNAITHPIETARNLIRSGVDKIKGIFSGLKLQLPHINLPHFSVSGGKAPWGIGGKGSLPSFSVNWYARGGYFDEPTLFAGVGERGGEFVWPSYAPYLDRYADALASRMGGGGVNVYLTYNGSGDADELVRTLTRDLRMMRATGAI